MRPVVPFFSFFQLVSLFANSGSSSLLSSSSSSFGTYRHPDAKITGEGTPTATGYLEVTVDGVLVHSKDNGDGYVDTAEKMEKILEAVRKGS